MTRARVETPSAPGAIGPYSQAIRCGNLLFLSGQIALDPKTGQLVAGDVGAQCLRVMENLSEVLKAAGAGFDDVVKTTVFLVDLADFAVVNEVYGSFLGQVRPARSTVQVAALPRQARVEIDAIAMLDD